MSSEGGQSLLSKDSVRVVPRERGARLPGPQVLTEGRESKREWSSTMGRESCRGLRVREWSSCYDFSQEELPGRPPPIVPLWRSREPAFLQKEVFPGSGPEGGIEEPHPPSVAQWPLRPPPGRFLPAPGGGGGTRERGADLLETGQ